MRNLKNVIPIMLIIFSISIIYVSCNKGAFNPTPLSPINPDLYVPKDTPVPVPNFKIYSWIRYNNTPGKMTYNVANSSITFAGDISEYGIHPFIIVAPSWLLDGGNGSANSENIINEIKFQSIAIATSQYPNLYVQLDEEGWDLYSADKRRDSLLKSIEIFRKYNTTSKIGFYAQLPKNEYNFGNIDNDTKYQNWQAKNDILKPVYDKVDVFFPSCYTRREMIDSLGWKKYALANIDEIRRISPTKPIIMGLTLQYDDRKYVEPEYLKYQLETLLTDGRIQGVFYWTSDTVVNNDGSKSRPTFNKDMPWFKPIQQFMKKHNIQ